MCLVINVNLSGINQGDCAGRNAEKRCRHEGTQQLVKWLHHRRRRRSSFRRHVKLFPIIFLRNKKEPKERKRSVYIKRRFKLCHNSLYFAFHHIKYGAKSRIFFDMISQIKREREHKTEKLLHRWNILTWLPLLLFFSSLGNNLDRQVGFFGGWEEGAMRGRRAAPHPSWARILCLAKTNIKINIGFAAHENMIWGERSLFLLAERFAAPDTKSNINLVSIKIAFPRRERQPLILLELYDAIL